MNDLDPTQRRLADQYAAMAVSLKALLDTDAGLRDALTAAHHTALITDLDTMLDIAAGLQVVVPTVKRHPSMTEPIPDGHVLTQPWPAGPADKRRDQTIYYQYRADRARRTLWGIDEQVARAEKAVAGTTPVKRNRFVQLTGATRSINRPLEAKARALAGLKGYVTNLAGCPDGTPVTAEFVIDAYRRLFQAEESFRMSKHDLQARPIYHHKRESIEAHLSIVFAALAVSRWIEDATGWSIKKFTRTARRYRTVEIQAGAHTITAEQPLPDDLRDALHAINRRLDGH